MTLINLIHHYHLSVPKDISDLWNIMIAILFLISLAQMIKYKFDC